MRSITIGGRKVVAFVEHSELGSNHIESITPIPLDGGTGFAFGRSNEGTIDVWGVNSERGKRIAAAYRADELPCHDVEELNRVLRPDEFAHA